MSNIVEYIYSKEKGVDSVKNVVLYEVMKELNWRESIVVGLFKKTFNKIYKNGIRKGFNWNNYVR